MASTVTSSSPHAPTGYRALLRTRRAWTFLLPGFAARQPFAMLTIGIVLLVSHVYGSYGTAGTVAAATGVSMALCAPQAGRLADRHGQAAVLVPGALLHAAAVAVLTALALGRAPLWALLAAAVPAGASVPQVGPMVRARWAALLGGGSPLLATAAAFESVTDEFTFVIGPVLATALCTGVHPAAGLLAEGALTLTGGLLFAARRATEPGRRAVPSGVPSGVPSAVPGRDAAVPALPVLVAAFLGIGTVFGGMQVSLTAFTQATGRPDLAGPLYGIFAGGNMLAGVVVGAVAWRATPTRRLLTAYPLLALACAALPSAGSLPLLGALGLLTGLCVAPSLVSGYTLAEVLVPAARRTEAFTWLTGAVALGQAAAATSAGRLSDAFGPSAGFLVPLAGTASAALAVVALRRRLVPGAVAAVGAAGSAAGHQQAAAVD